MRMRLSGILALQTPKVATVSTKKRWGGLHWPMCSLKDGGQCYRANWRKGPILIIMTIVAITTLATTLGLLLTTSEAWPPPLLLSPILEQGHIQKARDLSYVETDIIPGSHAGFLTVNQTLGNHLFFWFFPALGEKSRKDGNGTAPLLLWLNGGPGVSSMLGLFWEHGPLEVVPSTRFGERATFKRRCTTWAKYYSIIYVDNPVGVGYSFSDKGSEGYRLTQDGYAMDLHVFVKQFFLMFPEYKNRDFYIGGQSYAGRYAPALAFRIHQDIERGITEIPLKGLYLGAPYYDCENQMRPFYQYLYSVGVISHADMIRYQDQVTKLYEDFLGGRTKNLTLVKIFTTLVPKLGLSSMDNYVTGKEPNYASIAQVMTSDDMRRRLKVGSLNYRCISDDEFFGLYGEDIFYPSTAKIAVLLDNYKVLMYTGDYDVVVSSRMVDEALMKTPWSLQEHFVNSTRSFWNDKKTGELSGFYSTTGRLCRVVIHGAGHQVPHDRPGPALKMITDFIEHGCIQK